MAYHCKTTPRGPRCKLAGTLKVRNLGDQSSPPSSVQIRLSGGESYLKRVSTGKLKPGGEKIFKFNIPLPSNPTPAGKEVLAVIDPEDTVLETNEKNNVVAYGLLQ